MNVLARWWTDREVNDIRDQVQERLPITSDGVRKVLHAAEAVPASDYLGAVKALQTISDRSPLGTSSEAGAIAVAHRWLMDHGYRTTTAGGQSEGPAGEQPYPTAAQAQGARDLGQAIHDFDREASGG